VDPDSATDPSHIPRQMRRGISWNLLGAVATNLMRVLVVVVLGRLLDEHDFGVVAAALTVITVLHMVRDVGIGPALVQRKELAPAHIETAFASSTYLGIVIAGVMVAAAPLVAALFRTPECAPILRVLGVIFVLRGVATTSQMLCQRAMNFRALALIDTSAYVAGSCTSMGLAWAGMGPWSIAVGYVVEEAVSATMFLLLYRPRFALRIDWGALRDLLGFGAGQSLFALVNSFAIQGDNMIVGHGLGTGPLGFYTRAYDLLKLPSAAFSNIVGSVLFPAFSRLQGDPERLGINFRRVIFVNALLVFPASAILIALAPEVIRILMGPTWGGAVLPFQILAVTMMMRISYKVGVVVASAAGAVYALVVVNIIYAACVIGGALIGVHWGIPGVAVSTAISIGVMYLLCAMLGMRHCTLDWRGFAAAHVHGLALGLVVGACAWPASAALRAAELPSVITAATIGLLGGAVAIAVIAYWVNRGRGDFAWLGREVEGLRAKIKGRRAPAPSSAG